MALSAWLHCLHQLQSSHAARLLAELQNAAVSMAAMPDKPRGFGVLLFDQVDAALQAELRAICAHATVLAICLAPQRLNAHEMWAVLETGAADVLLCPPDGTCCEQVLARLRRWDAVQQLLDSDQVRNCLVGDSAAWRALLRGLVDVAAFSDAAVLITGETGTGKDLLAQLVHRLGQRRGELVVLDCTTLSPELSGSELFGHERGAYTGAANARDGAFALADGGTLFLDEVGELPLALQAQLLRAVQEHKYKRVGSNTWQPTQFRLVCATNRDLEADIANGRFRADLYYRIAGWRCRPPPLRERDGDILPLATHFLRQLAPSGSVIELDPAVRQFLLARDYPGNVRDLRQTVCRIWHRHCGPGPITIGDVPPDERGAAREAQAWPDRRFETAIRHALEMGVGLARISQTAADLAIQLVLEQEDDNNQRAALRLGVTDRALQMRRKARAGGAKPDELG